MDRHSIVWLCIPLAFPLLVVVGWLIAKVTTAFAKSRVAWIASALVLPHFASKFVMVQSEWTPRSGFLPTRTRRA